MRVVIFSPNLENAKNVAQKIARSIADSKIKILGPSPAVIFKIKNYFRFNMLFFAESHSLIVNNINKIEKVFHDNKVGNIQIKIDVDPYYFM